MLRVHEICCAIGRNNIFVILRLEQRLALIISLYGRYMKTCLRALATG